MSSPPVVSVKAHTGKRTLAWSARSSVPLPARPRSSQTAAARQAAVASAKYRRASVHQCSPNSAAGSPNRAMPGW